MNKLKSEKGSIIIETVMACLIFIILATFCIETFTLITTQINIQKVAREGAREAAIIGPPDSIDPLDGIEAGKAKAIDIANQCLKKEHPFINVYPPADSTKSYVICDVVVEYRFLKLLNSKGVGGRTLNARAIYPWSDQNKYSP